jgi:hypothetical protein
MQRQEERIKEILGPWCTVKDKNPPHPIFPRHVRDSLQKWMIELTPEAAAGLKALKTEPRRSALLHGKPGTGKTSYTHTFAAHMGLPLAIVDSNRVIEKWVGESAANCGRLLKAMDSVYDQCLIFFDEIDALATARTGEGGASREREQAMNVLMTGLEDYKGIWVAATNLESNLDGAFWRRFNLQVHIPMPGPAERFAIIRMYAEPLYPSDDATQLLVDATANASPALIKDLIQGVKRNIVLWPMIYPGRELIPSDLFRDVITSLSPPPKQEKPPLWLTESAVDDLDRMDWPWRDTPPEGEDEE